MVQVKRERTRLREKVMNSADVLVISKKTSKHSGKWTISYSLSPLSDSWGMEGWRRERQLVGMVEWVDVCRAYIDMCGVISSTSVRKPLFIKGSQRAQPTGRQQDRKPDRMTVNQTHSALKSTQHFVWYDTQKTIRHKDKYQCFCSFWKLTC